MTPIASRLQSSLLAMLVGLLAVAPATGAAKTTAPPALKLRVDAREVAQNILRVRLEIPVGGGPMTLLYPKWIPGEHGPSGPIANFLGPRVEAAGQPLAWRRDGADMFAYQIEVPAGARSLVVSADVVLPGEGGAFSAGASASSDLAVLNWNQVVLYPKGWPAADLPVEATLVLPDGWRFGTSLTVAQSSGSEVHFETVALEALIDSPVIMGRFLETTELGDFDGVPHRISIAADSAAALTPGAAFAPRLRALVEEFQALFGARHYNSYRWLLALSDHVQHFGLEHHQSSDNRREEAALTDEKRRASLAGLLAHEYAHSWNGKYRRPRTMLSPTYQEPMRGELLWVYEGLTDYLGTILPARSGFWTAEYAREELAETLASLDTQSGRAWRPLRDTADFAQVMFQTPGEWRAARRGADFYDESVFVWLEADAVIRSQSGGKASLDDFLRRFHGGTSGGPQVVPYTFEDLVAALNAVAPTDWSAFFRERVFDLHPRGPMGGVEKQGWRLVYNDQPNQAIESSEHRRENRSFRYTLGVEVDKNGKVADVLPEGPAFRTGIVPGMKLLAVAGRRYSGERVDEALRAAKGGKEPISFVVEQGEEIRTVAVDYREGPRYPHLERIAGQEDTLTLVLQARRLATK